MQMLAMPAKGIWQNFPDSMTHYCMRYCGRLGKTIQVLKENLSMAQWRPKLVGLFLMIAGAGVGIVRVLMKAPTSAVYSLCWLLSVLVLP